MNTLETTKIAWPPEITVKKHPRARHVKLKASSQHGLELIVPKKFNVKEIPFILEQNRSWIEKQLLHLQNARNAKSENLPDEILFKSISQTWQIDYIYNPCKLRIIPRPHQELVLFGNIDNKAECKKLLITWIKKQAHLHLLTQLQLISQEIQLPYNDAIIRDQRSRWGSCSSEKLISLNYKLLFLPFDLMRNIIIHELCHTIHLNHSEKFWQLVEKFDPNWKTHRRDLRKADPFIPGWLT